MKPTESNPDGQRDKPALTVCLSSMSYDVLERNQPQGLGLPGFRCAWDAQRGARQLYDLFKRIEMTKEGL
jgi:hypothetical protein